MDNRKIIHFHEEKLAITWNFCPKECQECELNANERLDTCFE